MFLHDIKIALRNLRKNRQFTIINVLGLTIGITLTMVMMMYVISEWSYDDYHTQKDCIKRISIGWGQGDNKRLFPGCMPAMGPALVETEPGVLDYATVRRDYSGKINYEQKIYKEENLYFGTESVFNIFTFEFVSGSEDQCLNEPLEIILAENIAEKYFGAEDPVGKVLRYGEYDLKVSAVFKKYPANSHFYPELIISYSTLKSMGMEVTTPWNTWGDDLTYILADKNIDKTAIEANAKELLATNGGEYFRDMVDVELVSLKDIHWRTDFTFDIGTKGNKSYVFLFLSSAFLILLIAGFNFVNLTTARSFERMREVGIRKVVGASRFQLIRQFLYESVIVASSAIVLALVLFESLSQRLYGYIGVAIEFNASNISLFAFFVLVVFFLIAVVVGSFPAFYISRFRPAETIKQNIFKFSKENVRRILVVSQFAITMFLVCTTIFILDQLNFMRDANLGLDRENVAVIRLWTGDGKFVDKYPVLRDQFISNPDIVEVSAAYTLPGVRSNEWKDIAPSDDPENNLNIQCVSIDYNYVKTLGLKILEGRNFELEHSTDLQEGIILNEAAVKVFGLENPVGSKFSVPGRDGRVDMKVIGVVNDFHLKSLHNKIMPLMLYINPDNFLVMAVKISDGKLDEAVKFMEEKWSSVIPGVKFDYTLLDESYRKLYAAEEIMVKVLSIFSGLALFVAGLGLLGLASFIIARRSKEIGVRKVLGASSSGITYFLSKEFLKMVVLGVVLTSPLIYYTVQKWLEDFAYRIDVSFSPFLMSAAVILFISLATVVWQSVKVATSNPVDALRDE